MTRERSSSRSVCANREEESREVQRLEVCEPQLRLEYAGRGGGLHQERQRK